MKRIDQIKAWLADVPNGPSAIEFFEELDDENYELHERLQEGRDYLMSVEPSDLTVEDALEALGFERNGLRSTF